MVSDEQPASLPDGACAPVPAAYQAPVDEALQHLYTQYHRLGAHLSAASPPRLSLAELRRGPLAEVLSRLAQIAAGEQPAEREPVLAAIDAVLQLLFWPPGAETYTVPRTFWEQPLGRLLAQAKLRAYAPGELMSIGQAAHVLSVTRPTIYRWMDEQALDYVRDDMSGRTFVVRREVEALRDTAAE
jgi:excisionase family DNA binding protein